MSVVLLILSRSDDRERVPTLLRENGYCVHEASSIEAVIDQVIATRPMAVLMDAEFPDAACPRFCRTLRQDRELACIPVLMLAEDDQTHAILDGLHAGADDYVTRGSDGEIVLCRLRRLIRDRQLTMAAMVNEQLAQIGRLLTGIVHEIRGPLSVIRGHVELARMKFSEADECTKHLDPILRNAQLMQSRLDHLMASVRSGPPALEPVEINELVFEATDLFHKGTDPRRNQIAISTELAEGLPPASVDPGRLIQVLMNLMINAREAILASGAEGGAIRVRTSMARDRDVPWILIEVDDNGPGLPEGHLDRIFEPFFTTKIEGSGYGLYLAAEIIREHGGRVTARASDLGGACFMIWLPLELKPIPTTES